jgi:Spy/CpxP family protein refolding chaperone
MDASSGNRRAYLLVLAVFLLGIGLGALGMYVAGASVWGARPEVQSHRDKRARFVEQLTREVSLTPEQRQQLDAILADMGPKFRALHDQIAPRSEQLRQQGRERIRAILTPEQQPKYEEFLGRLDAERKKREER